MGSQQNVKVIDDYTIEIPVGPANKKQLEEDILWLLSKEEFVSCAYPCHYKNTPQIHFGKDTSNLFGVPTIYLARIAIDDNAFQKIYLEVAHFKTVFFGEGSNASDYFFKLGVEEAKKVDPNNRSIKPITKEQFEKVKRIAQRINKFYYN